MTTHAGVFAAPLFAAMVACTGQIAGTTSDGGTTQPLAPSPFVLNTGDTIGFSPSSVDVNRYPSICGVMNPPFTAGDLFSMDVIGSTEAAPYDSLDAGFTLPAPPIGTPIVLNVSPPNPAGSTPSQYASNDGITFSYTQGKGPGEIDLGAFDSVVVTLLAMPTAAGEPMTMRFQVHFIDGKVLDETFSGTLYSSYLGCGAG
jgi:hypothetical protein